MTYEEVRAMPVNQLFLDLEMMSLEGEYGPAAAKPPKPTGNRPNVP